MGDGGGVVVVSTGNVDGTRGSFIVCSAADVIGMSVVRRMRGVGGVCEMCMCLALGGVCVAVGERIGFGLYQPCGNRRSVGRVYVFGLRWCGWCR